MNLLIAYDGSASSQAAMDDLSRAGLPAGCRALVLSAVDAKVPMAMRGADVRSQAAAALRERVERAMAEARKVVEGAVRRLSELFPGWKVESKVVADSPAWAIIKHAEGHEGGVFGGRADLVVVGSHGRGAIRRILLGNTSHKVVTRARCSTRVARAPREGAKPSGPPRLLVGTDGSECSARAVEWVGRRAWPEGTEIIVATSDECTAAFDPVVGVIPTVADEKWAMETAKAAAEKLRRPGLKVAERTAVGMAHHVLLDIAEQERVDCVFVGAHGMGAVERWLLGSVSSTLAVHAPCSVEIVHPAAG